MISYQGARTGTSPIVTSLEAVAAQGGRLVSIELTCESRAKVDMQEELAELEDSPDINLGMCFSQLLINTHCSYFKHY